MEQLPPTIKEILESQRVQEQEKRLQSFLENEFKQQDFELKILSEFIETIPSCEQEQELFSLILKYIQEVLPIDVSACIVEFDQSRHIFMRFKRPLSPEVEAEIINKLTNSLMKIRCDNAPSSIISCLYQLPTDDYQPHLTPITHIGTELFAPLIMPKYQNKQQENWILGMILVASEQEQALGLQDIRFFYLIANQGVISLSSLQSLVLVEQKRLANLVTMLPEGVILLDIQHRIVFLNPVAQECLQILTSASFGDVLEHLGGVLLSNLLMVEKIPHLVTPEGRDHPVFEVMVVAMPPSPKYHTWLLTIRDITEQYHQGNYTVSNGQYDLLTGLINRYGFEQRLEQALINAQHEKEHHSICYLDLENFQELNDNWGRDAGDELLRQIADLLTSITRQSDVVARLENDDFAVLFYNCSLGRGLKLAQKLQEQIAQYQFIWQQKVWRIGVSIGVFEINYQVDNVSNAMQAAASACNYAKYQGHNLIETVIDNGLQYQQKKLQQSWLQQLHLALAENHFHLYYQSIVPLKNDHNYQINCEILLRLEDSEHRFISPEAFYYTAERYHLWGEIDRWVIVSFFSYLAWLLKSEKKQQLNTSQSAQKRLYHVNLSGESINDNTFLNFVKEQFEIYQIPPKLICFEITESIAIANFKQARSLIEALKDIGCCFALDDFGTGMSSLAYLKNLPVDYLKFDGSFIKNIVADTRDAALIAAISSFAQNIGIKTVAEFVETEAIKEKVRELGVDYAQGYAIDRPQPIMN